MRIAHELCYPHILKENRILFFVLRFYPKKQCLLPHVRIIITVHFHNNTHSSTVSVSATAFDWESVSAVLDGAAVFDCEIISAVLDNTVDFDCKSISTVLNGTEVFDCAGTSAVSETFTFMLFQADIGLVFK